MHAPLAKETMSTEPQPSSPDTARETAPALSPAERFRTLVNAGDAVALRAALERDAALRALVNEPLFAFDSPALVAMSGRDNLALVDTLLGFGADPNRKSGWWAGGFHPLHSAKGSVAARLLEAGAVPDACAAAALDRPDLLRAMLAADPARVHERGGDGQTPLHFARSREVADMLIDTGADLDARDLDHRASAAEWMLGDRADLARHLVGRGARADIFLAAALGLTDRARSLVANDPSLLALRTSQGEYGEQPPSSYHIYQWTIGPNATPLQAAVRFGHRETLDAMQAHAMPVQRLLLACHEGDGASARAIVRDNPGIVENLDGADRRALTDEAWAANAPAVELMMELGFDPSVLLAAGAAHGTALHCAAWAGSVECVSAILSRPRGRDLIGTRDARYDGTPLDWCRHAAANSGNRHGDYPRVEQLLADAAGLTAP
jgi:ankyrin repeat protein